MNIQETSYSDLFRFVCIFIRKQRFLFFLIFFVSFAWSLDVVAWPYVLRLYVDLLTQHEAVRSAIWQYLFYPASLGITLWLAIELSFRFQGFLMAHAMPTFEADMRLYLFDHVQHHSPKYFNDRFAGSLANKVIDMTTQTTLVIQHLLFLFFPALVTIVFSLICFSLIDTTIAWIFGSWIAVHLSICLATARNTDRLEHIHGEVRSELLGKIVDSLQNNYAVNLFFRFKEELSLISKVQSEEKKRHKIAKIYIEKVRIALGISAFFLGGLSLFSYVFYAWSKDLLTTGQVIQIFNTSGGAMTMMWHVGTTLPSVFQSIGFMKQALSLIQEPQDILDQADAKPLVLSMGSIVFDKVTFKYGDKNLFKDKSIRIEGGEKVGVVGYSGAGKSSFANLILRFYPLDEGRILIDGQDIASVTLESLRRQVALIPQDPLLFHRTLKENIRYGCERASDEEVYRVAKLAHCDSFITRLPEGYDSLIGERGAKLSGGERQRVAIARAMLAKAPVLILDEATSALDSVTERYIQESLQYLMEGKTVIAIAHRLSTLKKMDRLLVFDKGRVIEEGSHEALLANEGHYARMWQMQAGGFLAVEPSLGDEPDLIL